MTAHSAGTWGVIRPPAVAEIGESRKPIGASACRLKERLQEQWSLSFPHIQSSRALPRRPGRCWSVSITTSRDPVPLLRCAMRFCPNSSREKSGLGMRKRW